MMTTCHTTECILDIPAGWSDETGYVYTCGGIQVVAGPFAPRDRHAHKVAEALETFRLSVPAYELIERTPLDRPAPNAELIALKVGGNMDVFELSIFWPIGDVVWVFRARGPRALEESCREAAVSFLETYQPVQREEEA